MITVMKLQGGWNAIDGMVLTSSSNINPSSTFSTTSSNKVTTKSIAKPTFAVIINNKNLNVSSSQYYTVVMNYVVYIPLSLEVLSNVRLSGGWHESYMALYSY